MKYKYRQRGRQGRYRTIYGREWNKLIKLVGLVLISGSSIMTKKFQKLLRRSDPYLIKDIEEGKWTWKIPCK